MQKSPREKQITIIIMTSQFLPKMEPNPIDQVTKYTSHETEEYTYTVNFRSQFQNYFGERIKSMGNSYFYLDTSENGIPSFTIWGNSSGIIKLKKEIKTKFPNSEILEVSEEKLKCVKLGGSILGNHDK